MRHYASAIIAHYFAIIFHGYCRRYVTPFRHAIAADCTPDAMAFDISPITPCFLPAIFATPHLLPLIFRHYCHFIFITPLLILTPLLRHAMLTLDIIAIIDTPLRYIDIFSAPLR